MSTVSVISVYPDRVTLQVRTTDPSSGVPDLRWYDVNRVSAARLAHDIRLGLDNTPAAD